MAKPREGKGNFNARGVKIYADRIEKPRYNYGNSTDGKNSTRATGRVKIVVKDEYPNSNGDVYRPPKGTVLVNDDKDGVGIQATRIERHSKKDKDDRMIADADGGTKIFGKLHFSFLPISILHPKTSSGRSKKNKKKS